MFGFVSENSLRIKAEQLLCDNSFNEALPVVNQLLEKRSRLRYLYYKAYTLKILGDQNGNNDYYVQAIDILKKVHNSLIKSKTEFSISESIFLGLIFFLEGSCYSKINKIDDAINNFEGAASLLVMPIAYNRYAIELLSKGRLVDALNCFDKAIALNEEFPFYNFPQAAENKAKLMEMQTDTSDDNEYQFYICDLSFTAIKKWISDLYI